MSRRTRFLAATGVLLLVAGLVLSRFVWLPARPYPIEAPAEPPAAFMTYEEYGKIDPGRPYVFEAEGGAGRLLYFGIRHTNDPADPEIAEMRARWAAFRPTVALCEGHLPLHVGGREGAIRRFGESAEVRALAREAGVPLYSIEPTREAEVARLLERFPPPRTALFLALRRYISYRRGAGKEGSEAFLRGALGRVGKLPGLEGAVPDVDTLAALYAREFPDRPDWREVPDSFFDPGNAETWMNEIQTRSNRFRDSHMVAVLLHLVGRGERVFAAVGGTHVVMAEPALKVAHASPR